MAKDARAVIIGAGIVGNSVAYHLARLGWRDLVLLDKGPLPNPGGSTGHASNFIFPVDHSKEMTLLTQDSMEQYKEMGVFVESGGMEVARTEARMEELKRRLSSATSWGEPAELISAKEAGKKVPYLNTEIILGAFWSPRVGVVDSLRAGTIMRERAAELDALQVFPSTKVTGISVERGHVTGVRTNRGDIKTETILVACGVWSPRIARMAGAVIPLTPAVHQMISVGPISLFEGISGEIAYPIVRDMDTFMYERQNGNDMEVGSYAHRPILHDPDDIPSIEAAKLSPTELPFTEEDFDPQMEQALELMPDILTEEGAGIRHAINGLLSLTPDGLPLLGETPEVKGLWSVAAVWIKEAPGIGRLLAEWLVEGYPEIDPHGSNIARLYEYGRAPAYVAARTSEGYNKTYGIVHPMEQWLSARQLRLSPFYRRAEELGAVFFETAGWERPYWYESNAPLLEEYADRIKQRPNEWDARWWSPNISAEHLAMRDRAAMVDLSAFTIFDVVGPGCVDYLQRMAVADMDVAVGKAVYTPILDENAGFRADLTIMRTGEDRFRVVTGGGYGGSDRKWFQDHLPQDGSVQLQDRTSSLCTLGLWGPRARDILQAVADEDVSGKSFPFASAQALTIGPVRAWALRISYVGELGWEIYAPIEQGQTLWDLLWEAGEEHRVVPAGIGVYGTSARLEKGYRLYGHELELDYNPVEAGLARSKVKDEDFIGKEAYERALAQEPAAQLCTLSVLDHASASGEARYMLGREPILTTAGERIVDAKGRGSYVTSAGTGASVGKHLLMGYLPPEHAVEGEELRVLYFGEKYPVKVEVVGSRPLFDPQNDRMKG